MIKNKKSLFIILEVMFVSILLFLDQISKHYIYIHMKPNGNVVIISDILEFQYVENTGAAFGMLQDQKIFFLFITVILSGILIFLLRKIPVEKKYFLLIFSILAILTGGIGNAIDRIRFNFVIDFIYIKIIDFPVFNFADFCISSGTICILFLIFFRYKEQDLDFLSFKQRKYRQLK